MINKVEELYKEKKYEACIPVFEQILQEEQKALVDIYAKLAISYRMIKRFDKSEEILKKGLEAYPENNWLIIEFAALRNRQEKWEEAIELWGKAKRQSDNFSELNYERYLLALQKSNSEELLKKIVSEGLKKFPNNEKMIEFTSVNILVSNFKYEDINYFKNTWNFENIDFVFIELLKDNNLHLFEYILFLADTGQLDKLKDVLQIYGVDYLENLINSEYFSFEKKHIIKYLLDFMTSDYMFKVKKEDDALLYKLMKIALDENIEHLQKFIVEHYIKLFSFESDARHNMILNFALNKLYKANKLNHFIVINALKLYLNNDNINLYRKKFVLSRLIPFAINNNLKSIFKFNNLNRKLIRQLLSFLHNFSKNELGAKRLYIELQNYISIVNFKKVDYITQENPRIAVCISGMYRICDLALETINYNIIKPLNADVFIHTWDRMEVWPGTGGAGEDWIIRLFGTNLYSKCPNDLRSKTFLKNNFPNFFKIIDQKITDHFNQNKLPNFIDYTSINIENEEKFINSFGANLDKYKINDNFNQLKMFYGIWKSHQMAMEYEKDRNFQYDYIVRCRPDVALKNKLTLNELESLDQNEIGVDFFDYGPQDQFRYGSRNAMFKMASIYESMLKTESLSPFSEFNDLFSHNLTLLWMIYKKIYSSPSLIKRDISLVTNSLILDGVEKALEEDFLNNKKLYDSEYIDFFKLLLKHKD